MMKHLIFTFVISAILLPSCHKEKKYDPNYIKVGVESGPEYVIAQTAQKIAKEKYGLEVELVEFNDYVLPNTALNDGDIDANAIQHKPFLDDQIERRGYKLAIVGNTFIYPLAGYSNKIKSVKELQDGSTIAIPNDATNRGRALLLLQKQGLIRLKNADNLTPGTTDIIENPKKLKIVELEAPQLPNVLDDKEVTIAIINNTFATKEGLTLKDGIFVEDRNSPYINVIVAREDNKDAENVKKFVQAYQSEEVAQTADREFKGGAVKGW
ncbi:MAG: methionine ABC transporter substrate-binding lipoprotein MetQ [Flavobacteriaceae bacterium]|nr:methionine ABC transporter substrate-binding lipoprotein MetQ [Flavobacteriaceae bacterium]